MSNYATDVSPIILDIETCGIEDPGRFLDPVQPDARLKDPDKIAADIAAKTQARLEKLALDWNVGRVAVLGWWTERDGVQVSACQNEGLEATALGAFFDVAKHRTIVGFNCKGFDLRFLVQRSRLLGIRYPQFDFSKYSRKGIVDLYLELTFNEGHYDQGAMRRTLSAFARRFGIPCDDPISGKDVPALLAAGQWQVVADHCRYDLALTVALARKMGVIAAVPQDLEPTLEGL